MLAILLLALTLGMGPAALEASPTGPAAPDLGEPILVRIDAVASDARGRVVDTLRAEDFEILEDGAPRPIESVRFVRAPGSDAAGDSGGRIVSRADEHAAAAQDGTRLIAIFLDEYHVAAGAGADRAR